MTAVPSASANLAAAKPADLADRELFTPVTQCAACGGTHFKPAFEVTDPHYGNAGTFHIDACTTCGLQFLNPMPTAKYLATAYPDDYPVHHITQPSRLRKLLRSILFFDVEHTGDPKFPAPGRAVDIGCATGVALMGLRDQGWTVTGVEIGEAPAEIARNIHGLNVITGTLHDAKLPDGAFDYVRMNHSFEHVNDPVETAAELRRIIAPGGMLFIGVPNVDGLAARLFGKYWWNRGAPVHTFGYSPKSLSTLLEKAGFKVVKVQYNSNFGSFLGSLQIYLNRDSTLDSHHGRLITSMPLKVIAHWLGHVTDMFRQGDCMELIARPK
jgi:SAM-dependent methyltransferase